MFLFVMDVIFWNSPKAVLNKAWVVANTVIAVLFLVFDSI